MLFRSGRYTCLGCAQEVVPVRAHERRLGAQVVEVAAHFRHLEQGRCAATGESVTHRAFKRTLAERLRTERQFTLHLNCPLCHEGRAEQFTLRPGWWVTEEWPLGEHRLDVAVLDEAAADAGAQVRTVWTKFLLAEEQSNAHRAVGDLRPFVQVVMADHTNDGLAVMRLSQLQQILEALSQ